MTASTHQTISGEHLDKATIYACSDVLQLRSWHEEAYDIKDEIKTRIEAYDIAGTADEDWVRRASGKVGVCSMIMRWIARRLAELGEDPPVTAEDHAAQRVAELRKEIKDLRSQLSNTTKQKEIGR